MTTSTLVERRGVRARRTLLAVSTILCSGLAAPAFAQTAPPPYVDVDTNGVDLVSGNFVTAITEGSIGSGEGAVSLVRARNGSSNWTDNWSGGLMFQTVSGTTTAYVIFGEISDTFSVSGSTYTSLKGNGATLVANSVGVLTGYLYTAADGTQIQFTSNGQGTMAAAWPVSGFACASYSNTSCSIPISITKPDGMKFTLSWTYVVKCISGSGPTCVGGKAYYRFGGVTSSSGFGFTIGYLTNVAGNFSAPQTDWYKKTGVTFSNASNPPASSPTITYPTPAADYPDFTDPAGRAWVFGGGIGNVLTSIQRPGASSASTTITYGGTGGSLSAVTLNGITTNYSRVVSGSTATTTVTDALSHQTIVVADLTKGRVTQVTRVMTPDPNLVTAYSYDSNNRLTEVTYPEGNKIQYAYDGRGNVTSTTLKAKPLVGGTDIVTSANYDTTCTNVVKCNSPNWTKDANLNQTDYTYDTTTGQVTKVTSPAPVTLGVRPEIRYTYTATSGVSLLTGVSTCQTTASCAGTADEVKTSVSYNSNLLPSSISKGAGDGSLTATQGIAYDPLGYVATVDGPLAGTDDTTTYRHDVDGELVGTISPDPDGAGALKRRAVKTTYNADGQPTVTEVGTVNGTTDTDWAAFISLQQQTDTYDANARKTKDVLTASSTTYRVTQYSYDAAGKEECTALRMNSSTWGSLPSSACTLATTGSAGPDRISKTSYDAADRPTLVQTAFGTADAANEASGTYNKNGTIATLTDAQGNMTTYEYDGFDRLAKTRYPDTIVGAGTSSTTDYEQRGYDANGNVTVRLLRGYASDSTKYIAYAYDALNRLTYKDLPNSEPDVSYTYDNLGRLTLAIDGASNFVGAAYDALDRTTAQSSPLGVIGMGYDLAGRRTQTVWPDSFYVNYDHLVTGEVTAIRENGATSGVGVLASYTYDDLGRRTGITRGNGTTSSYGFDAASKLTSLAHDLYGTSNDLGLGFSYNPAGQIAGTTRSNDNYAWTGSADVNKLYTVNGLNQATSSHGHSIGYDARGNLISFTGTASTSNFTYSSENLLLTGPSSATLAYDPLMRLYEATGSATEFYAYDGAQRVGEYNSSGTLLRRYVFGPGDDEPLVWYEGSSTSDRRWLHADERGSVVAVTNSSGVSIGTNSYDEYGVPGSGNIGKFQYTGQAWLPDFNLYYYKARIYSSRLGRFMQTDPIGYDDGMNWYNYVGADPVNFTDPTGLDAKCGSGAHWVENPTGSRIPQCVPDNNGSFGSGVASGYTSGTALSFGGGGAGLSGGYYVCTNCGDPAYMDGGDIVVTAPNYVFVSIGGSNSGGSFFRGVQSRYKNVVGSITHWWDANKGCISAVGDAALQTVIPYGLLSSTLASGAVGAGYEIMKYNGSAGGVMGAVKLAPAGGAVSRLAIARSGALLAAKLNLASTALIAGGAAVYTYFTNKACR